MVKFALKLNMYGHPEGTPFHEFIDVAVAAEELGFDAAFTIDHLFLPPDQTAGFSAYQDADRPFFPEAWTAMAALAARTSTLRIGPQVTPIMRQHPAVIAKLAAGVDHISEGRFVLQVGTGWNPPEYEVYGLPYKESFADRYEGMVEGIEVIDRLWRTDGPVTFEGNQYQLNEATLYPKPVTKPRPPIWIGGSGAKTRRAVAQYGDAWTPAAPHYTGLTPEFYTNGITEIRETAEKEFDRDPDDILAAALFFVVIDETSDAAASGAAGLRRREAWSDMSIEEMAERGVALIGDPDDVTRYIQRFVDIGVEYFTLGFVPINDAEETIRRMRIFSENVMPAFT